MKNRRLRLTQQTQRSAGYLPGLRLQLLYNYFVKVHERPEDLVFCKRFEGPIAPLWEWRHLLTGDSILQETRVSAQFVTK